MKSESQVQSEIMMTAALHGVLLMRNNSGAGKFLDEQTGNSSYVRFGLHNNSKEQNARIKSSDLIGLGRGRFFAIECKHEGWRFNPKNEREQAQKAFIDLIKLNGGVAGFCTSTVDFLLLVDKQ